MGRQRESRETWKKRVERWEDSGLTAGEFSTEMGINPRTLTYWKYQFGKEARAAGGERVSKPRPPRRAPDFVEAVPAPKPRANAWREAPEAISIEVAGVRIRVPRHFDSDHLAQVVQALRTAC